MRDLSKYTPKETDIAKEDVDRQRLIELLGSDEEADRALVLIDGIESYPDIYVEDSEIPDIALEGWSDWLKTIERFFKVVYDTLTGDQTWLMASSNLLKFRLSTLQREARAYTSASRRQGAVLTKHIQPLCVNYQPLDNIPDIVAGVRSYNEIVTQYLDYVDRAVAVAGDIERLLTNADPVGFAESTTLSKITSLMESVDPATLMHSFYRTMTTNLRNHGRPMVSTDHLMGNIRLVGTTKDWNQYHLSMVHTSKYELTRSQQKVMALPKEIQLRSSDRNAIERMTRTLLGYVKAVDTSIGNHNRRRDQVDRLGKATINLLRRAEQKGVTATSADGIEIARVRSSAQELTRWSVTNYRSVINHYLRAMHASHAAGSALV